jgi:hypothetical protein
MTIQYRIIKIAHKKNHLTLNSKDFTSFADTFGHLVAFTAGRCVARRIVVT